MRWRRIPQATLLLALVFVAINIWGVTRPPHMAAEPDAPAGYGQAILSASAITDLQPRPTSEFVREAHWAITYAMRHGQRRLAFRENWVRWVRSHLDRSVTTHTQDVSRLIAGQYGWCSQSAAVLQAVAKKAGLRTRFIGFEGHVMLEVETPDGWWVADTDYGIRYEFPLERLQSPEGLEVAEARLARREFTPEIADLYLRIVAGRANRWPIGQVHEPGLLTSEKRDATLSWAIPFMVLGGSALLLVVARVVAGRRERHPTAG